MEIKAALALGGSLLREHGLDGWRIGIDGAKTRAGVCRFARREIGLSGPLTLLHDEALVRDTLLHEIAHALVGPGHAHGETWRAMALQIGCNGERLLQADAPRVSGDWVGTCPKGHQTHRHRRPQRVVSCSRCTKTFDPHALLSWTYRGRSVEMPRRFLDELRSIRRRYDLPTAGASAAGASAAGASADGGSATGSTRGTALLSATERGIRLGDDVIIRSGGPLNGRVGVVEAVHTTRCQVRVGDDLFVIPLDLLAPGASVPVA